MSWPKSSSESELWQAIEYKMRFYFFFKNRHKRDEISSCIVKRTILSCSPQRWESGEEFLTPSNEIANEILDIAAVIEDRWRKSLKTICRSHHVLESHIRRFISLVANVNLQLEDLRNYTESLIEDKIHFSDSQIGLDVYNDVDNLTKSLQEVQNFIKKYAQLAEKDLCQFKSLMDEIDTALLELMYLADELELDDGVMIVFCVPTH